MKRRLGIGNLLDQNPLYGDSMPGFRADPSGIAVQPLPPLPVQPLDPGGVNPVGPPDPFPGDTVPPHTPPAVVLPPPPPGTPAQAPTVDEPGGTIGGDTIIQQPGQPPFSAVGGFGSGMYFPGASKATPSYFTTDYLNRSRISAQYIFYLDWPSNGEGQFSIGFAQTIVGTDLVMAVGTFIVELVGPVRSLAEYGVSETALRTPLGKIVLPTAPSNMILKLTLMADGTLIYVIVDADTGDNVANGQTADVGFTDASIPVVIAQEAQTRFRKVKSSGVAVTVFTGGWQTMNMNGRSFFETKHESVAVPQMATHYTTTGPGTYSTELRPSGSNSRRLTKTIGYKVTGIVKDLVGADLPAPASPDGASLRVNVSPTALKAYLDSLIDYVTQNPGGYIGGVRVSFKAHWALVEYTPGQAPFPPVLPSNRAVMAQVRHTLMRATQNPGSLNAGPNPPSVLVDRGGGPFLAADAVFWAAGASGSAKGPPEHTGGTFVPPYRLEYIESGFPAVQEFQPTGDQHDEYEVTPSNKYGSAEVLHAGRLGNLYLNGDISTVYNGDYSADAGIDTALLRYMTPSKIGTIINDYPNPVEVGSGFRNPTPGKELWLVLGISAEGNDFNGAFNYHATPTYAQLEGVLDRLPLTYEFRGTAGVNEDNPIGPGTLPVDLAAILAEAKECASAFVNQLSGVSINWALSVDPEANGLDGAMTTASSSSGVYDILIRSALTNINSVVNQGLFAPGDSDPVKTAKLRRFIKEAFIHELGHVALIEAVQGQPVSYTEQIASCFINKNTGIRGRLQYFSTGSWSNMIKEAVCEVIKVHYMEPSCRFYGNRTVWRLDAAKVTLFYSLMGLKP